MPVVHANGIEIDYAECGDREAAPVVLLRGLSTQRVQWFSGFLEDLAGRGYRVITPDNRDAGLSTSFDHRGVPKLAELAEARQRGEALALPYTLEDMAADVVGLLDALGLETAHLVGMSMGGMIAQLVAADHGARLRSLCSVMSTSAAPGLPGPTPEAQEALLSAPPSTEREDVIRHNMRTQRVIASPGFAPTDAELREYFEVAYDRSYRPAGTARQFMASLFASSRLERLAAIRLPTLVIHGDSDPLIPLACGRDTAERISGAKFEVIAGMGHDVVRGNAPLIAELLDQHWRAVA